MNYKTKTTKEDFKELFGVDLDVELGAMPNDTGDKPSSIMIKQVEDYLVLMYSEPNYNWNGDLEKLNARQIRCFKNAVCYQIDYMLTSGELNHSGFNNNTGNVMITREELMKIGVGIVTHTWMRKGGMANLC